MIITAEANLEKVMLFKYHTSEDGNIKVVIKEIAEDENLKEMLKFYFLSSFKTEEYFHLGGIEENKVYQSAIKIFADNETIEGEFNHLAELLTKRAIEFAEGEFFTAYFSGIIADGEEVDALGLFYNAYLDHFIKLGKPNSQSQAKLEQGIQLKKPTRSCLVLNTETERGCLLGITDIKGKNGEPSSWRDLFLGAIPRKDEFFNTSQIINLCKDFITDEMPKEYTLSKADQVDFMNKSVKFMKENEVFDMGNFKQEVIGDPQVQEKFSKFTEDYQYEKEIDLSSEFEISPSAVKKQSKIFRSIIKLDKNFHVYVHGNQQRMIKGYDEEKGMHFYQLYYEEEN